VPLPIKNVIIQQIMKNLSFKTLLLSLALLIGVGFLSTSIEVTRAATFYAVQTQATRIYSSISSSATSVRLKSFKDLAGTTLTMASFGDIGYGTFDPGVTNREESFTGITNNGDGTVTLTGLTRGLLGRTPFGTGGTAYQHDANSFVVISNGANFYNKFAIKVNNEPILGQWRFDTVLPESTILATTSQQFVTKAYVDGGLLAGAATATQSVTGISRLASASQAASSTASTANTPLVIQAQTATDTPNTLTRATRVLMSDMTGFLKQGWINLTENFTWTGSNTFATTTFNGAMLGGKITIQAVASTTLTSGTLPQPVFLSTTTKSINLSGNCSNPCGQPTAAGGPGTYFGTGATTTDFIGFALQNAPVNTTTTVQVAGVVTGFSGLVQGENYYVSGTGTINTFANSGGFGQLVGQALSATDLLIKQSSVPQLIGSTTLVNTGGTFQTNTVCTATTTMPAQTKQVVMFMETLADGATDSNLRTSVTLQVGSMNEKIIPLYTYNGGYNFGTIQSAGAAAHIALHGYIDTTGLLRFDGLTPDLGVLNNCKGYAYFFR
jgi:hypothetical protein